jgi:UDP-N-acetylglucosamine 2-epimerase (non-hydrolysing)
LKHILHVVGARPNFPKIAPLIPAIAERSSGIKQTLVHTGQHYDYNMSRIFFDELSLPEPDFFLGIGSGTHAFQTAQVMLAFEPVVREQNPDLVVVVGDVNSTLACALVSVKMNVKVAHVEAGLRSWDRTMPEEINRLLTDQVSDLLFTPSKDATENLKFEGIPEEKIFFVGNVMIDTLVRMLPKSKESQVLDTLSLAAGMYILVTLHRPSNVDHPEVLLEIIEALEETSQMMPVVFPVHPRTRQNLERIGKVNLKGQVRLIEPLGYVDFLSLTASARVVLTDSGGVQEETTYLGVPCLTARPNTERPVTILEGTNRLVESSRNGILNALQESLRQIQIEKKPLEFWDGQAACRIAEVLVNLA